MKKDNTKKIRIHTAMLGSPSRGAFDMEIKNGMSKAEIEKEVAAAVQDRLGWTWEEIK